LLLKYPSPEPSHGPSTFVEDAIYLRDNFDYAGGVKVITKYSGKAPITAPSTSRPETPSGRYWGPEQRVSRKRSPLPSPAKFLQQQGGVEGILHGAAKGVLERGERLGINQVVRDAVGEVKKNMQGLSPSSSVSRRSSDVTRRSLDENRAVPSAKKAIASIERRNKQLGRMLEDALDDLRSISLSDSNSTQTASEAISIAIAKVQFVRVYLEDSTMPLPTEPNLNPSATMSPLNTASEPLDLGQHSRKTLEEGVLADQKTSGLMPPSKVIAPGSSETSVDCSGGGADGSDVNLPATMDVSTSSKVSSESSGEGSTTPQHPHAPMPTRSSLAQSSFAWMLEPEGNSTSATKPTPPKLSSPFLGPGRRPLTGTNREKAAFLFGDDTEGTDGKSRKPSVQSAEEEGFNLGTIKSAVA
jgi:TBC1 domain family member 5